MSDPRYFDELPPLVEVHPALRTSAGSAVAAEVRVTNRSTEPRILAVTCLGVDADWLPAPTRSRPMLPGESRTVELHLVPTVGTLPAQYPLAVTVQALDPVSERAMSHAAVADITLVVDSPGQIEVAVVPAETKARLRRRISVHLTNVGSAAEQVRLEAHSPEAAELTLSEDVVLVAPGHTVRVPGRLALSARMFGKPSRFTYTVSARGSSAARRAEGSVTSKSFLGDHGPKAFVLIAVVTLWAGLALVFIPKLASTVRDNENKAADKAAGVQNSAIAKANDKAHGKGGASASPGKSGAAGGSGGAGSGGSGGSGGAATTTAAKTVQFSGTVGGNAPSGVTVTMKPTSLVDQAAQSAKTVGVNTAAFSELGKIPEQAVLAAAPDAQNRNRSTVTRTDGAWSFARVAAPGYYLLTFAKTGYQTQRYVLDSTSGAATTPLAVTLVSGEGRLSGRILSAAGPVGGAKVVISDGASTLTTSSNSLGAKGTWSVTGLSTPASYLVSATKDGLSTESAIVTLAASGTASRDLTLSSVATSLTGTVSGIDSLGQTTTLGGASVTVTDGTTTRQATTITSGTMTGGFVIPGLPPGEYTVSAQAEGYLVQTQTITVRKNEKTTPSLKIMLTSSTALVSGSVHGVQFDSNGKVIFKSGTTDPVVGPVNGAGIVLADDANTYKITSDSDGIFHLSGIAAGTYVLSAQFAGLNTAYTSVTVVAGQRYTVPDLELTLAAQPVVDKGSIAGFVSSAANPSGTIICADDVPAGQCKINFTLVDTDGAAVNTSTDANVAPAPTSQLAPETNGPTPYHLTSDPGLAPGLYRLTVSATGFLPATVTVRVPANGEATAPPVSLYPTNIIKGTIDALGDVYTDSVGGKHLVCAWAVPQSDTLKPTGCTDPGKGTQCSSKGIAEQGFGAVDPATNSYKITGLCDGTYTVYIVTDNPLYDTSTLVAAETVSRGQTVTYSPHIPRKGQVVLTLSQVSAGDGTVGKPAASVTGSVTCISAASARAGTTADGGTGDLAKIDGDGRLTVSGVKKASDVACTVNGSYVDDSGAAPTTESLTGAVANLTVINDTDTPAALTLTQQIKGLYGRLVSKYNSGVNAVGGATVQLVGNVLQAGAVSTATFTVTTDSDGCFAILPSTVTSLAPAAGDTVCSTFTAGDADTAQTVAGAGLVTRRLSVSYSGGNGLQPYSSGGVTFTDQRNDQFVVVKGDDTTTLTLTTNDPANNAAVSGARIDIRPDAAAGASATIQSKVTPSGAIVWNDPAFGANLASPGTYTLTATLANYQDISTTITCLFGDGQRCSVPANSLEFVQLGGLSGNVEGYSGPDTSAPHHALTNAAVRATLCQAGQPAAGNPCNGAAQTTATNNAGAFTISNGTLSLTTYHVVITATGYRDYDAYVTIKSGANSLNGVDGSGQQTVPVAMFASPFTLSVAIQTAPGTLVACKTSAPCNTVTVQRDDTGAFLTAEATLSNGNTYTVFKNVYPGTYDITVSGDGLQQTTVTRTIGDGSGDTVIKVPTNQYTNTVSGLVQGSAVGKAGTPAGLDGIPVELGTLAGGSFTVSTGTDGKLLIQNTASPAGQPGSFVFTTVPNGSYAMRVNFPDSNHPEFPVNPTYASAAPPSTISVFNGQPYAPLTVPLTRITHNVVVSIGVDSLAGSVGTGTSLTLTSADDPSWVLSNPSHSATATAAKPSDSWTFNAVPAGRWTLAYTLPTGHLGTPTSTTVGVTCTGPGTGSQPNTGPTCTSAQGGVVVPGNPTSTDTTVDEQIGYTLDEYQISIGVTAKNLPGDPNGAPPATVGVTVTQGGSTVYTDAAFGVTTSTVIGSTDLVWGDAKGAATYTVSTSSGAANWSAADVAVSAASPTAAVVLTEAGGTVEVTVAGTIPAGYTLQDVTLSGPAGASAAGPTVSGNVYTFTDVPYSASWTATATAAQVAKPDMTWSSSFAVTSATTVTVTVTAA